VVGVDDWAWRKGHRYGTVLVDLERRRPIDLLPDRSASSLAAWLKQHPSIEIVTRDRSTEYARGITLGAPKAIQVADRWHLLRNLRDALERLVAHHPSVLELAADSDQQLPSTTSVHPVRSRCDPMRRAQRVACYEAVNALATQGRSQLSIAKELNLSRWTVRRYVQADSFPEIPRRRTRPGMLQPFESYLQQRWDEGCRNGLLLWRELQTRGFPGSRKLVSAWVRHRRTEPALTTPTKYMAHGTLSDGLANPITTVPAKRFRSPRQVAWLLLRESADLSPPEQRILTQLCQAHEALQSASGLTQRFVRMLRERAADQFDAWLDDTERCGLADLSTFAQGLRQDCSAIRMALTSAWSTGQVEGQITRLKLLKRQMYGRANFDLLRKRVLAVAS
jgi:transposase